MKNFFGQLYIDLSTHLKTTVPELKWIDQDFGQLERFEYRPEVSFPCALVDFIAANYSNLAELAQLGEVTINIRMGFAPFSQAHQAAPMSVKEKALEYYTIEQKIFEALQGWRNNFTQPFIRISAVTEQRDNDPIGLRVRVITFTTSFEDESNRPIYAKHAATITFDNPEINHGEGED